MNKQKFDILFEDIMDNLQSKICKNCCELCGREINSDEPVYQFDDYNGLEYTQLCQECTENLYDEYKEAIESGEVEITEKSSKYDLIKKCDSCEMLYPECDLKDTNVGHLCEYCILGDISRGEQISINYN